MARYVHQIPLWSTLLSSTRSLCIPFVHYTHFVFWFWLYEGFVLGEIYYVNCRKNTENVKALKHLQKMKCVAHTYGVYIGTHIEHNAAHAYLTVFRISYKFSNI